MHDVTPVKSWTQDKEAPIFSEPQGIMSKEKFKEFHSDKIMLSTAPSEI